MAAAIYAISCKPNPLIKCGFLPREAPESGTLGYGSVFTICTDTVYVLYVRHSARDELEP
jgi:hypothetical protein